MNRGLLILLPLLLLSAGCASGKRTTQINIVVRGYVLEVEVAADPERRERGLMFRQYLPDDGGMLFVFSAEEELSFWMRNTYLPLSIAFLDARGRILNIEEMEPLDENTAHVSAGPAHYALEVQRGWFAARGIAPGDYCEFSLPKTLIAR
jgi:uncharacterized protein